MSGPTESPAMLHDWPDADENGGVDDTLLYWMLSLTPDQRLSVLEGMADAVRDIVRDNQDLWQLQHLERS